jgi:hypothetical protein
MSSTTTRLALYKPDPAGTEFVSVVTDINNNLDNLDSKVGFVACTSGTRPGSPFNGMSIRETDTGKVYIWDGAVWRQLLYSTAQFANALDVAAGATFTGGAVADVRTNATDSAFSAKLVASAQQNLIVQADGKMLWGSGAAVADVNLYRASTDTLKTDDIFTAALDLITLRNLIIGTSVYRNKASATTTVAGTAAETVIGLMTIPAADMAVGAIYRIRVRGIASVLSATTPTMIFRSRISGVAGTAIASSGTLTSSSGVTNKNFEVDLLVSCITTGAAGTIRGVQMVTQTLTIAGAAPSAATQTIMDGASAAITVDTTVSRDLVITAQWGTANASNTLTAYIVAAERVA